MAGLDEALDIIQPVRVVNLHPRLWHMRLLQGNLAGNGEQIQEQEEEKVG